MYPPPPSPRTRWTRRVPHPVLIGHAVCLVQVRAGANMVRKGMRRVVRVKGGQDERSEREECDADSLRGTNRPGVFRTGRVCPS